MNSLRLVCTMVAASVAAILSSCGSASTGSPIATAAPTGAGTPSSTTPPPATSTPTAGATLRDGCQLMSRSLAKTLTGDPNIGPASGAHPNCNYLDQTTGSTSGDHAGVLITPFSSSPTAAALQSEVQQNAYFDFPVFGAKKFNYQPESGLGDLAYTFTGSSDGVVFAKNGDIVIIYLGSLSKSDASILAATNSLAALAAGEL